MQTRYIYEVVPQIIQKSFEISVVLHKRPITCLVFEDGNVGISVCNKNDSFHKQRAREIAIGRLTTGSELTVPNRKMLNIRGQKTTLVDEVNFYLSKMENRATANLH